MRFGGHVVFALSVLLSSALSAQTFFGTIRGRLIDPAGTPVEGIAVRLTDALTDVARASASNNAGEYLFADLHPGRYVLTIDVAGFSRIDRTDIRVGNGSAITVDLVLELRVGDRVEVRGAFDRSVGVLAVPFSRNDLIEQPTAGRNIFIMGALAPTVLPTGNAVFVRQQDQSNASLISMAGSARRANTYVVDGVPIVDIQNRATIIPSMESVEEMRVQLGPYDTEVGRTAGGVFNVTTRAGSNQWSGSGVYQNRPDAGRSRLFFESQAQLPRVDTSYHLFAGSLGGPLARNRTFVFLAGEGYRTESSRNTVLMLPTAAERRGDFSQSGVTIYDPLTTRPDPAAPGRFIRDPFPNNQIPAARLNPVAQAMLTHLPTSSSGGKAMPVNAGVLDEARQVTAKLTHQWRPGANTSAIYAWYRSAEPDARFFGGDLFANGADPGDGALVRMVHFLALNQSWTPADRSQLLLRYGFNHFLDDNRGADFDPATLGFDARFVNNVPFRKFPGVSVSDYGQGGALLGDRDRSRGVFYAHNLSAVLTTLKDRHTVRAGAEYRRTGVDFRNLGGSGYFGFTRDFTAGPDPTTAVPGVGDAMASFLLGFPAFGSISTSSPLNVFVRHAAFFLQDDIRLHSRFTVTAGLRYEFEDGLREVHDRMAVGWAASELFPIQLPVTGHDRAPIQLRGGLVYAGVNGAPTWQGAEPRWRASPRVSAAFLFDDRTMLRGGYGTFTAPQQGISASEIGTGTRGYNVTTSLVTTLENRFVPCSTCTLTYPYREGIQQPSGNSLGVMTGVGGGVEFVDPASKPGYYHRYSIELQRQVFDRWSAHLAYVGAIGRDLAVGGSSGSFIDVNQLDPRWMALGSGLTEPVANPFFGTPLAVGILAGAQIPAAQLLRPYPQFGAVYALRSSLARSRYDALIAGAERRHERWSARANYTYGRQRDNQFGESNFFSEGSGSRNYYDIESEYGVSVLDTPHRFNLAGTIDLPFGLAVAVAATMQSGFPIAVSQAAQNTGLPSGTQRPNRVPGVSPVLTTDPVEAFDPRCMCIRWLNPAAWTEAPAFTFGNAPRADGRARTPGRKLVDVAVDRRFDLARRHLTLRAEVINVLNARDFRGPNTQWGSATFGEIRSDSGFPRTVQVRARYAW